MNNLLSVNWTSREDETLIEFVKKNEALYNVKGRDYRNAQIKQDLWNGIGLILGKSGFDCCKRWSYVRDYYIRRRGKPGHYTSGEAAKRRASLLTFLDCISLVQKSASPSIAATDDGDSSQDCEELVAQSEIKVEIEEDMTEADFGEAAEPAYGAYYKRRKMSHSEGEDQMQLQMGIDHCNATLNDPYQLDETDLFFHSMAKIVKKLPRVDQIQLRIQVGNIIQSVELKCAKRKESDPTMGNRM